MGQVSGAAAVVARPLCLRCGYDLSGVVATWGESCPLEGVCSECGAGVVWSEVAGAAALGPRWSIEHGRRVTVGRWWGTLRRSVWPRWMWRELNGEERVRAGRLALYALGTLGLLHVLLVVGAAADLYRVYGWVPWSWYGKDLGALAWPYGHSVELPMGGGSTMSGPPLGFYLTIAMLPTMLMPVVLLVMGVLVRRWRVEEGLLLRGACYTAPLGVVAGVAMAASYNAVMAVELRGVPAGMFPDRTPLGSALALAIVFGYPIWLCAWWRSLLRDHARVGRAGWRAAGAAAASVAVAIGLQVAWEVYVRT